MKQGITNYKYKKSVVTAKRTPYSQVGGYSVTYYMSDCEPICKSCLETNLSLIFRAKDYCDKQWQLLCGDIYWEGDAMTCCNCNGAIDSEYGPLNDETTENQE